MTRAFIPEADFQPAAAYRCGRGKRSFLYAAIVSALVGAAGQVATAAEKGSVTYSLDLPEQTLDSALQSLALISHHRLLYSSVLVDGKSAPALRGSYTAEQAVQTLLSGTGLTYHITADGLMLIKTNGVDKSTSIAATAMPIRLAQADSTTRSSAAADGGSAGRDKNVSSSASSAADDSDVVSNDELSQRGIPEILVTGKKSLNVDIQRTEDDPQPYVVFSSEEVARSQTTNLEEFLRTRLPMNTASSAVGQTAADGRNNSTINLRGLGANETLILVDGRRMPGAAATGNPAQPDINGIPLSSIERIEVLPAGAGGIYGGSATGGVVNIVLKRDFQGVNVKATYGNTFEGSAIRQRIDASGGFTLEDGRTSVMVTATHAEGSTLKMGEREFAERALARQLANNPAAIYNGTAPPIGGTVNIRSTNGSTLTLDPQYGGASLGSNITHIPLGYSGADSDNGAALLANAGAYNLDLPGGVLGVDRGLLTAPKSTSGTVNVRRSFTNWLDAFVDYSHFNNEGTSYSATQVPNQVSNLAANAPNNPFQQAINVRFPTPGMSFATSTDLTTQRATGGLIARLPKQWIAEVDYNWSRSRFEMASTGWVIDSQGICVLGSGYAAGVDPDGAGSRRPCSLGDTRGPLNALQEGNTYPIDFSEYLVTTPNQFSYPNETGLWSATARLAGPILSLPAGAMHLSFLAERRKEEITGMIYQSMNGATREWIYQYYPARHQEVDSVYLETRVPLFSAQNGLPGLRELELQASVRHDKYVTRGVQQNSSAVVPSPSGPYPDFVYGDSEFSSTDFTTALRYAPIKDLALRGSFSTAALPASVNQIVPTTFQSAINLGADPRRGGTNAYVGQQYTVISGGNPNLDPELSKSWSAGLIFTPRFLPQLRLSVDYVWIDKTDGIQIPADQFLLDNEALFPGRIVRGANLPGDPAGWAGPIVSVDKSLINIAVTEVESLDLQLDYRPTLGRFGQLHIYVVASRQMEYTNQTLPGQRYIDFVGFNDSSLEWRGTAGLNWTLGGFTASWNTQYYDSYFIYTATSSATTRATAVLNQGAAHIPNQMYHDLMLSYRVNGGSNFATRILDGVEMSFGVQNVFDKLPPVIASSSLTDRTYSLFGDPRLRRYSVSFNKGFDL